MVGQWNEKCIFNDPQILYKIFMMEKILYTMLNENYNIK